MSDLILTEEAINKIAGRTAEILKADGRFPKEEKQDEILNIQQIEKLYGIKDQTIRNHIKKGLLIGKKIGKRHYFTKEQVDNYLKSK